MRILVVPELFYPDVFGGGEVFAYNVAKALVVRGHEVHVIAPKTSTAFPDYSTRALERIDGIIVHRVKGRFEYRSGLPVVPYVSRLERAGRAIVKAHRIEIVNPHAFRPCLPLYLASRGLVPCVATIHDVYSKGALFGAENWIRIYAAWGIFGWGLEQAILRLPYTRVMTVSSTVKGKLTRYMHPSRIDVVQCGVDVAAFPRSGTPKVRGRVAYLGRMIRYKNVYDSIQAVGIVRSKIKDAHILLAGSGPLSGEVADFCQRAQYATYVGTLDMTEKIRLLSEAEVVVLPSSEEGWGLTLAEANACFTPYVAYDLPAIRELTNILRGGVLAKHRDVYDLAEKISFLLENPETGCDLAATGRETIATRLTWDAVAARVESGFKEAIGTHEGDSRERL